SDNLTHGVISLLVVCTAPLRVCEELSVTTWNHTYHKFFPPNHASIICNISVSRPPVRCRKLANRKLKSLDTYALKQDLAAFDCVPDIETRQIVSRLRTLMSLFRATT
ncbi:unnamed protein product, partial [Porites evermanni]